MFGEFPERYDPTRADFYSKRINLSREDAIQAEIHQLEILDTAGQEEYSAVSLAFYLKIRENYLRNGNGFVLVYSVGDRSSFYAVNSLWEHICKAQNTEQPRVILIGNKADLPEEQREVSEAEGKKLAEKWGAFFLETSARSGANVEEAFMGLLISLANDRKLAESRKKRENTIVCCCKLQ